MTGTLLLENHHRSRQQNLIFSSALFLGMGLSACEDATREVSLLEGQHDLGSSGEVTTIDPEDPHGMSSDQGALGGGRDAWVDRDGGPVESTGGSVSITEDGQTFECQQIQCRGKVLECGDCIDNDGDGKTDWRDPECLGPCDNTEGPGLSSGVGGETRQTCSIDCYFDFGNGSGNDRCTWDHRCDPLSPEVACSYEPERLGSRDCPYSQDSMCETACYDLTPNGCDCFGCCTFPELETAGDQGEQAYVWIGHMDAENRSTCTLDSLSNTELCPRCTPVSACLNECGRCEICLGKTELPSDCFASPDQGNQGGPNARCSDGSQPCGQPQDEVCPEQSYCVTGCCKLTLNRGK